MTDKIEINFKSIRKNSTSCVCKIDGKFLFVFHDSVIVPSSSTSIMVVKPSRESLKRFLRLEKELKKMSTDVFDDAEEISSVVVDAEKGKLIRCRLKEPLEQKRGDKVTLTLRLVGVRLTRMVSELIWDFVKSEKEEKDEDKKEEVTNQKKSKNKKCEIPDSDSESEEGGEEEEVTDCVGDAIEDLRADLLETLNHKVRCAKRDMDHLQWKLTKFQEWLEELDERKRVTLDTIERISAQPEVNEEP